MAESPVGARFLPLLNQNCGTEPVSDQFLELDEHDVVWPPPQPSSPRDLSRASLSSSPPPSPSSSSSSSRRSFVPQKFGLSAALAEPDSPTIVRSPRSTSNGWAPPPFGRSAPVSVPSWPHAMKKNKSSFVFELEDCDEENDHGEWVPPHVMATRSHVTTFSVFEGAGRTLKGRDLRRVRNAVWRQTGFLD